MNNNHKIKVELVGCLRVQQNRSCTGRGKGNPSGWLFSLEKIVTKLWALTMSLVCPDWIELWQEFPKSLTTG